MDDFIRAPDNWRFQNLPMPFPEQLRKTLDLAAGECFRADYPYLTTAHLLVGLMKTSHFSSVLGEGRWESFVRPGRVVLERRASKEFPGEVNRDIGWVRCGEKLIVVSETSRKCLSTAIADVHNDTTQTCAEMSLFVRILADVNCDGYALWGKVMYKRSLGHLIRAIARGMGLKCR